MLREYNVTPRSVGQFTLRELETLVRDYNQRLKAAQDG